MKHNMIIRYNSPIFPGVHFTVISMNSIDEYFSNTLHEERKFVQEIPIDRNNLTFIADVLHTNLFK